MVAQPNNCLNPDGRPPKPIDWALFEQLCAFQCTQSEICSTLKVNDDTLRSRILEHYGDDYSNTYKKYSETGKCSLRRNQFVLSKKNAALAIWLGKIWLGQKDETEVKQMVSDAVREAVREIARDSGIETSSRPLLEDKQSILHQRSEGQPGAVPAQLGTKDPVG